MEAVVGFEPTNGSFANCCLGPLGYTAAQIIFLNTLPPFNDFKYFSIFMASARFFDSIIQINSNGLRLRVAGTPPLLCLLILFSRSSVCPI